MTPEQTATVLLGISGAIVQLLFMYVPKLKDGYEASTNKGLIMLGVVVVVGVVYFALGCTSLAAMLGIALTCDVPGAYTLLQAIFIIASAQQLTYLFTRKSTFMRTT